MFISPAEPDITKLLRREFQGLHLNFHGKFPNLPFELEIGCVGVLDMGNANITMKNSYDVLLRVYASTFS